MAPDSTDSRNSAFPARVAVADVLVAAIGQDMPGRGRSVVSPFCGCARAPDVGPSRATVCRGGCARALLASCCVVSAIAWPMVIVAPSSQRALVASKAFCGWLVRYLLSGGPLQAAQGQQFAILGQG